MSTPFNPYTNHTEKVYSTADGSTWITSRADNPDDEASRISIMWDLHSYNGNLYATGLMRNDGVLTLMKAPLVKKAHAPALSIALTASPTRVWFAVDPSDSASAHYSPAIRYTQSSPGVASDPRTDPAALIAAPEQEITLEAGKVLRACTVRADLSPSDLVTFSNDIR